MANSDRLERDAHVLDGRRLIDGEAHSILSRSESVGTAVRAADCEERATHNTMGVSMHQMIERVA